MNVLDAMYVGAAAVTAPWWARKSRGGWGERFGKIEPVASSDADTRGRALIHAVSVGEVSALRAMVPVLSARVRVMVSASTDTGLARARELYSKMAAVRRYPIDASWAVRRFLDAARPNAVGLVELEIWPNFVRECGRRGIPVGVVNGRLSERSFRGYMKIRRWLRKDFAALAFAAVQDDAYATRFRAMGVPDDRCLITGSMKWDAARIEDAVAGAPALADEMGIDRSRPIVVAGSTGPGEEELLAEACPAGAQLLCAPRKPERFDEAASALPGCRRRSRPGDGARGTRFFLLDTIGELRKAYSLATVVVVGRSFGDLYGSDPIEPAALGKPVVIGPAISDFTEIVNRLLGCGGLVQTDRGGVGGVLARLLDSEAERSAMAAAARECVRSNQGASVRHAELIEGLLGASRR